MGSRNCRDSVRKGKAQNEQRFARDAKIIKNCSLVIKKKAKERLVEVKGDGEKILTRIFNRKENGILADKAVGGTNCS